VPGSQAAQPEKSALDLYPALQPVQAMPVTSLAPVPVFARNLPASQLVHAPPAPSDFFPASQEVHASAVLVMPASVACATYFPASQFPQVELPSVDFFPAAQVVQTFTELSLYCPARQGTQAVFATFGAFPPAQLLQAAKPVVSLNKPGPQAWGQRTHAAAGSEHSGRTQGQPKHHQQARTLCGLLTVHAPTLPVNPALQVLQVPAVAVPSEFSTVHVPVVQ
jgi:hypothetical protein